MKKSFLLFFTCSCLLCFLASDASGFEVYIDNKLNTGQDVTDINGLVHELGLRPPFEPLEWIESDWVETSYRPCPDNPDDPCIPNVEVSITNMTPITWTDLHYVADPETTLQNYDKNRLNDQLAFVIDYNGINTPLIYESKIKDLQFQPNETWKFVIQDYFNSMGGPPHDFNSLGVPTGDWPPSTGSIIAVPGPATICLLALGGFGLLKRRSRK